MSSSEEALCKPLPKGAGSQGEGAHTSLLLLGEREGQAQDLVV